MTSVLSFLNELSDDDLYAYFNKLIDICCEQDEHNLQIVKLGSAELLQIFPQFKNVDQCREISNYFIELCHHLPIMEPNIDKQLFNENVTKLIEELLAVRCKEIYKAIVFKSISSKFSYLKNYDWNISAVLCNDELANVNEFIFKLDCKIIDPNNESLNGDVHEANAGGKQKDKSERFVSLEFTKDELKVFLEQLQEAKKSIDEKILQECNQLEGKS